MGKILYLVRHAKTEQDSIDDTDFSRVLKPRGLRDSTLIGSKLAADGKKPDINITSTAARAKQTAEILASKFGFGSNAIHQNEELYMASARTFLQVVNNLKNDWGSVMMVGHNPVMTYLAEYLTDYDMGYMPTGAVVAIKFPFEDWGMVSKSTGEVEFYLTPKMLKKNV